jgi:hypothetical protein
VGICKVGEAERQIRLAWNVYIRAWEAEGGGGRRYVQKVTGTASPGIVIYTKQVLFMCCGKGCGGRNARNCGKDTSVSCTCNLYGELWIPGLVLLMAEGYGYRGGYSGDTSGCKANRDLWLCRLTEPTSVEFRVSGQCSAGSSSKRWVMRVCMYACHTPLASAAAQFFYQ